jgi:hypothetical protein
LDPLCGEELVTVRLRLREPDVVYVKGVLEASEGLGAVFAEPRPPAKGVRGARDAHDGGAIVVAAPRSRKQELTELIADLRAELGFFLEEDERSGTEL